MQDEALMPPLPLPPMTMNTSPPPSTLTEEQASSAQASASPAPPPTSPPTSPAPPPTSPAPPPTSPVPPPTSPPPTGSRAAASSSSLVNEKSLLATRGSDNPAAGNDDSRTPPPYSGPSNSSQTTISTRTRDSHGPPYYPGLPRLDYKLYSPPLFSLSSDCTALSSKAEYLTASASALVSLIRTQASIPPKPLIHIKGTRGRKVDFDIRLNLMGLLVPDEASKRMQYLRCVSRGELAYRGGVKPDVIPEVGDRELEEWCRRFIEDPAQVKSFALDRVVANMDTMWIEGQLRSLIASTQYKGVVHISFPVTHAKVVVHNPDRVNKFFTSVTALFSGKHKYEVVQSVWPFASARNGEEGRKCGVQSEEVWWREWRDPIKYAISQKRQNGAYVTNEDKLEALMEGKGKGVSPIDWGGTELEG